MQVTTFAFWRDRLRASGIHLGISLAIALAAAALVFGLWYPYPYREISGGRDLFMIVVAVDVVMGPLITLAIFNRAKPRAELRRDLAIVGLLQLAALGYGLWTVLQARPVYMAFEGDRFRVVHAVDVPAEWLPKAPEGLRQLPMAGPGLVGVRPFANNNEQAEAVLAELSGVFLGTRPDLWQPFAQSRERVLAASKPVTTLRQRYPAEASNIDQALAAAADADRSVAPDQWRVLPLVGRQLLWTAVIHPQTGEPVAYLPLDSF
jgi:hypothetical protein